MFSWNVELSEKKNVLLDSLAPQPLLLLPPPPRAGFIVKCLPAHMLRRLKMNVCPECMCVTVLSGKQKKNLTEI